MNKGYHTNMEINSLKDLERKIDLFLRRKFRVSLAHFKD